MVTADLKLKLELINKITKLKEIRIVKELKKLLDFELDEDIYELSHQQKNRIAKAKKKSILVEKFTQMKVLKKK